MVEQAYDRWAPIYDLVFGGVFSKGRRAAILATNNIGGRVLEVGVGTGISLPFYARRNRLYGIDISEPMLARARDRVRQLGLDNVEAIEVMDAEALDFPDDSFDVVVAQYVVTAVPHPERALDEFARVVRPGGEIVIATRIGAETGMRKLVEKSLMPVTSRLGWRTEFAWRRYADWAEGRQDVRLVERRPLPPLGHFSLVRFEKLAEPARAAA
jgi:phosphatidylethanolamine/phosphatidyl-N-methylethanolamine N-methyltransferase